MTIFTGTSGNDSILGTSGGDDFHLEQGGNDSASGAGGVDVFYMGASFNGSDQIDGGGGADFLMLDGDYSAGVAFTATSLTDVERIHVAAGHDYVLSGLTDANISGGMLIDGSDLGAGDSLSFDASLATLSLSLDGGAGDDVLTSGAGASTIIGGDGDDVLTGGAGNDSLVGGAGADVLNGGDGADVLIGGGGNDTLNGGAGNDTAILLVQLETVKMGDGDDIVSTNEEGRLKPGDKIDGGAGHDDFDIASDQGGNIVLHEHTLQNFETMRIFALKALSLTMADGNVAAGQSLSIDATFQHRTLVIDASAETDGTYSILGSTSWSNTLTGGAGADTLVGGNAADTLIGGAGDDQLTGGNGDDKLVAGAGQDMLSGGVGADRFFFLDVSDSTPAGPDLITDLDSGDVIDLQPIDADSKHAGNQAFHIVSAFTGKAGELVVSFDSVRHVTDISGDVNGDGQADLLIQIDGSHAGFSNFVL